jgi:tRNA(Leu) C34 or U34 (ribose-2'-O)-methylase TrmL
VSGVVAPIERSAGILLVDPKYPHNVGGVLRAAAILGAEQVRWTGARVPPVRSHGGPKRTALPREERLKDYQRVDFAWTPESAPDAIDAIASAFNYTPVALEVRKNSEALPEFVHPERALYIFGPEDGTLGRGVLSRCHRFVAIPSQIRSPLNLAAAVNVVLYDRLAKERSDATFTPRHGSHVYLGR